MSDLGLTEPQALEGDWPQALAARAEETEAALDRLLVAPSGPESRVWEAMRYAALGGGKRLRAFLALESAALCGAPQEGARRVAAAIECAHAYSLIHDDLPSMDDDDLRRGRPTTHLEFDEATAILAGDALQSLAFEILAAPETTSSAEARAALCLGLARAIGPSGMVAGQMIDLLAEGRIEGGAGAFDLAQVERLQALKTGVLIRFSAASGALLAGEPATGEKASALGLFADRLGAAFQIRDDLLDVEGDETDAGKRLRKDADAGKATYLDHLGVEGARSRADALVQQAQDALAPFGPSAARLCGAAEFAVSRSK